jgi:pRiA4b ORF-3-like protein
MEGEDEGTTEEQVRLDEVLAEVGDTLAYAYDYGDGWQHLLTLEAVLPRDQGVPKAVCTGGERGAPAEDCGGVYTYELISAAIDPANPNHAFAVIEFAETFGDQVDPRDYSPTAVRHRSGQRHAWSTGRQSRDRCDGVARATRRDCAFGSFDRRPASCAAVDRRSGPSRSNPR